MIAGMLVLEKSHHAKLSREILVSTSHIYIKHFRCCCNLEMFEGKPCLTESMVHKIGASFPTCTVVHTAASRCTKF